MNVSVIIPTINEPTLEEVIRAVKKELPDAEIIVAGFGSSRNVTENHQVVFLDMEHRQPKPVIVNKAVRSAKYPWIIILDADAIPRPGWGIAMLRNFESGKEIFCGSLDMSQGNFWMKVYNLSSSHEFLPENKPSERRHLASCNLGFTKEVYDLCGDWNEEMVRSQDYEWTLRIHSKGFKLWFDPKACVRHIPAGKDHFADVWKAWERNGFYNWQTRIKYRDLLGTPKLFDHPWLILLFSPLLAFVPTLRISKTSPHNFYKFFYLLPFVYLTKIAWCLGVFRSSRDNHVKK